MHYLTLGVETLRHGKGEVIVLWSGTKSAAVRGEHKIGLSLPVFQMVQLELPLILLSSSS